MTLECSCGKRFRSYAAEAMHRHNFPVFCRPPKRTKAWLEQNLEKNTVWANRERRAKEELLRAIDHPLLREVFGSIEDSGTAEDTRRWGLLMSWFDERDEAIATAKRAS